MVSLLLVFFSCSAYCFPSRYDKQFEKASEMFLPGVDYRLLKAQCYQESRLDPLAISPVGAKGLCQFMPGTWKEVSSELKWASSINEFMPEHSINAAAYYDAKLRKLWKFKRPHVDRMSLVFASYNAGAGNILKAQKLCNGETLYKDIIQCLPNVTGKHSKETTTYVERIWMYFTRMILG